MGLYKTKGIVLRTRKLGEADKIITLYTNTRGKLDAVAKGIRRTKSKFGARLEPFSFVSLLVYEGRTLDIISQAETIDFFKPLREDLERMTYASAVLELIDKLGLAGEGGGRLFELLAKTLEILAGSPGNQRLLLAAFNLKAMALSGYRPDFNVCASCRKKPGPPLWFSPENGGLLCHQCAAQASSSEMLVKLSVEERDWLSQMLSCTFQEISVFQVDQGLEERLLGLSQRYFEHHLQLNLKSQAYRVKGSIIDPGSKDQKTKNAQQDNIRS